MLTNIKMVTMTRMRLSYSSHSAGIFWDVSNQLTSVRVEAVGGDLSVLNQPPAVLIRSI